MHVPAESMIRSELTSICLSVPGHLYHQPSSDNLLTSSCSCNFLEVYTVGPVLDGCHISDLFLFSTFLLPYISYTLCVRYGLPSVIKL